MSGGRFHLVTVQGGREFVSTIALSKEDASGSLGDGHPAASGGGMAGDGRPRRRGGTSRRRRSACKRSPFGYADR